MFQSVNFSSFCDSFRVLDRQDQFTYAGKRILFDYLEQYEEDTGESIEFDVIALCCDYVESTVEEIIRDYSIDTSVDDDVIDWLNDRTSVCGVTDSGAVVFAQF